MFIPIYDHNPKHHIRRPYVTYGLIALNVLMFVVYQGMELDSSDLALAFLPVTFTGTMVRPESMMLVPEVATLFTYAFLHSGWMHLLGNMVFLFVFGDNVEDAMGHVRFLIFYLLCAAGGAIGHMLLVPDPSAACVGASGAGAGVIGAYLMLHPRVQVWVLALWLVKIPLPLPAFIPLGGWLAWNLAGGFGLFGADTVSYGGHLGGFLVGILLVTVLRRRGVLLFDQGLEPQKTDL
ncbi:MAG: rhomboid family intramembrane serine protease [Hyphomicrobiaceae bacterium]|nr:rhomboid family intramembrane serine protease [Hyphomicrobiaceae bacterium]